jgi:hypothetical protein
VTETETLTAAVVAEVTHRAEPNRLALEGLLPERAHVGAKAGLLEAAIESVEVADRDKYSKAWHREHGPAKWREYTANVDAVALSKVRKVLLPLGVFRAKHVGLGRYEVDRLIWKSTARSMKIEHGFVSILHKTEAVFFRQSVDSIRATLLDPIVRPITTTTEGSVNAST